VFIQAWLAGGEWHRLLPADHAGLPEVKWCMNRFVPFLAIDPQPDLNPGSRDAEEASMEVGDCELWLIWAAAMHKYWRHSKLACLLCHI
jgi:hypothetical protein